MSLVSDDQKMMSAHKLVLSASSPYFKHILTTNKHSHPLLCLDGVSSAELQCVLDYIYQGEVQIYQEQLDRFLVVAQRLQLEGLTSQDDDQERKVYETNEDTMNVYVPEEITENPREKHKPFKTEKEIMKPRKLSTSTLVANNSNNEIDQQLSEFIVRGEDGVYSCGYCGKAGTHLGHLKNHVETHMEGLSFPCQSCDKTFRSRHSLATHSSKYHRS